MTHQKECQKSNGGKIHVKAGKHIIWPPHTSRKQQAPKTFIHGNQWLRNICMAQAGGWSGATTNKAQTRQKQTRQPRTQAKGQGVETEQSRNADRHGAGTEQTRSGGAAPLFRKRETQQTVWGNNQNCSIPCGARSKFRLGHLSLRCADGSCQPAIQTPMCHEPWKLGLEIQKAQATLHTFNERESLQEYHVMSKKNATAFSSAAQRHANSNRLSASLATHKKYRPRMAAQTLCGVTQLLQFQKPVIGFGHH